MSPRRLLGWGQGDRAAMERRKEAEELRARSSVSFSNHPNGTISIEKCGPKLYVSVTLICRCWLCCSYSLFRGRRICLAFLVWWDLGPGPGARLSLRKGQSRVLAVLNLLTPTVRHNFAIIKKPLRNSKASAWHRGPCIPEKCIWSSKPPLCVNKDSIKSSCFKKQFVAYCIDANGCFGKEAWR